MKKFVNIINEIGIFILSLIINNFWASILLVPIFLLSLFFENQITDYILVFSLTLPLFAFAVEGLSFSYHEIFVNDKKYFKNHFFKEVKDSFVRKYVFYLVVLFLAFYGLYSLDKIRGVSSILGFLYYLALFVWVNLIFFTLMQVSLRDQISFHQILLNSLILTVRYFFISLINFFVAFLWKNFLGFNIISLYAYINIFAFGMVFVNKEI